MDVRNLADLETLLDLYHKMVLIRQFESTVEALHMQARLVGSFHSSVGQEAVPVGACYPLRRDDYITSTHRGQGHVIAKGVDINRMMAELFGRADGYCLARGGSMHIADPDTGVLGENGIVGAGMALATGAALSCKRLRTGRIVLCFFGDGPAANGIAHETMNMASIWELPLVFLCENNQFAHGLRIRDAHKAGTISERAALYGMPGISVDGNDVQAVARAAGEAVERARQGGGPSLVECVTYRWASHSLGEAHLRYRTREEIDQHMQDDPIKRLRSRILELPVEPQRLDELDKKAQTMVDEAVAFAESRPQPLAETALQDVLA